VEEAYGDILLPTSHPKYPMVHSKAEYIYGDTDSVFFTFNLETPEGDPIRGKDAIEITIELAKQVGDYSSMFLKAPHGWVYEKTICPFALLRKKGYVGVYYEQNPNKGKLKSMGIVLKRRDNAPIVKYVYGGAIENILVRRDIVGAFEFVRQAARELLAGRFSLKRLTITKSLRAEYKAVPAHKILADRIGKRDPGNKPASNDRIPFVYIAPPKGKKAPENQGERIETPSFIRENSLQPDYVFYITNQIAKPVSQVFGLVVERLPGVKPHQLAAAERARDPVAAREALAEELLFGDLIRDARREAAGQKDIRSWFTAPK
jgi:DNA polymerase elongation subunit (family B)